MTRKLLNTLLSAALLAALVSGPALAAATLTPEAAQDQAVQDQDQGQAAQDQSQTPRADDIRQVLRPEWYRPVQTLGQGGTSPVVPLLKFGNWLLGIFGALIILMAVYRALLVVWHAVSGKETQTSKAMFEELKPLLYGVAIVLLAVTGAWYDVFFFIWSKVVQPAVTTITSGR